MNFRLNNEASVNGTSLAGYVSLKPKDLVKAFGKPSESDGYKVSGEYAFEGENGTVLTLYDYKHTSLYDKEGVSPLRFWASNIPYDFHIGAQCNLHLDKFIAWITKKVTTDTKKKSKVKLTITSTNGNIQNIVWGNTEKDALLTALKDLGWSVTIGKGE